MNKKNLISLIIPVFNCEKFLPALFASLDNQSTKLFEVVLIDDNSKDNSKKLISDYAKHNKNVKTKFLGANKGVSSARNIGVELVTGNYLWFVDGDDTLSENAIETLQAEIRKNSTTSVFVFGYNNLDISGKHLSEKRFSSFEAEKSYPGSVVFYQFNPAPWNKLFKTSHWKKHGFNFPAGISIAQDLSIIYYAVYKASAVTVLDTSLYNYYNNESSSVNSFNTRKINDIFAGNQELFNNFFSTKKTIHESVRLRISEITIHSIDYFYARFSPYFSKKDHELFLKLLNTFFSKNNIDITSLLSWKIGAKTLIEIDEGLISNRIKGSIHAPFRSIQLSKQIQETAKLKADSTKYIQKLEQEIANKTNESYETKQILEKEISELKRRINEYTNNEIKQTDQINQLFQKIISLEESHILEQNNFRDLTVKLNQQIQANELSIMDLREELSSSENLNKDYKHSINELNEYIESNEQKINQLQNKLTASEVLNEDYKNRVHKLNLDIDKLNEAINWYNRTYRDRKLPGIIKDRLLNSIPSINLREYIPNWRKFTQFLRSKKKLKRAAVKSSISEKTLCAIVNYNLNENALKLKNSFSRFFDTIVFDSGSEQKNKEFVLLDNVYYSGLFNHAYQFALDNNYSYLFYICSDVEVKDDQLELMVNNLNKIDLDKIGVYSPSSTGRSHFYCRKGHNSDALRSVPFVEGFIFMAHMDILKNIAPIDLTINKYGWGLDVAKGYFARKLNKLCVVDDAVSVHHPEGTGYSDQYAETGMWDWMKTFQDENFKRFYTKQIDVIRKNQAGLNKVSVIIPCYNQASYMEETIHSLLMQEHGNIEILILNDGSTDNTEEIALKYSKQYTNIKYIYKKNGGLGQTRNEGLKNATGEFIQFLDSDDLLSTNKIFDQVYDFILNPEIQVSYSEYLCFEDGIPEKTWTYSRLILKEDPVLDLIQNWETELSIPVHCFLFRASLLKNLFFDEELPNHEDWEFHLKVAAKKPVYKYEPNGIAYYRVRNTSMSRDRELMIKGKKMCIQKAIDSNNFSYLYLDALKKRLNEN